MAGKMTGGCLCGEVRYESEGEPKFSFFCHCINCKRANGSAYTAGFLVDKESFKMLQGEVKGYSKPGEANVLTRQFCPTCGSGLFTVFENRPNLIAIKIGTLDDASWFKPDSHIWARSELECTKVDDGVERFQEGR